MASQNIKLPSELVSQLKSLTQEKTGQGAVEAALEDFLRLAKQRTFIKELKKIQFRKGFDPLHLRTNER
jgi:hypothetical protein